MKKQKQVMIFAGILTPSDEFQYWSDIASSGASDRERAEHIQELFQPISKDFGGLDNLAFADVMELVEVSQDTLDEVWKQSDHDPPYPEARMKHLLEIIGQSAMKL